jgi:signal transduction histidine kinase
MMGAIILYKNYMNLADPVSVRKELDESYQKIKTIKDFPLILDGFNDSYFSMIIEEPELIKSSYDDDPFEFSSTSRLEAFTPRVIIDSRIHTLADGRNVLIIFGLDLLNFNGRVFPMIFLVSSLIVLIVLSLFIIRSINKSISRLEEATGEIARGNLDFELETGGNDRFGSLARSLDTMRDQIKMEYDRRNRFFMGISHDLKTPLASITGYADALTEGMAEDPESMDKYLNIIKDKSHLLEQRITHLIHYLKLSNYDFQTSLEEKSLASFLRSFLEVQSEEAGFHGYTLEGEIGISDDLLIQFDEDLLGRALENLLQNAYRYGSKEDPVRFDCYKSYDKIELVVENKGVPIPLEQQQHLFEPFFRGDKARKGDGFGLGLASVKSIIESHNWTISVDSIENRTRFSITIPAGITI